MPALTPEQARRVYDRIGGVQDWQRFYEDPATDDLAAHAGFGAARAVVELGCGTCRFAAALLARHLPNDATYLGVDEPAHGGPGDPTACGPGPIVPPSA